MRPILEIADELGLTPDLLNPFGQDKAKIRLSALTGEPRPDSKLILMTAMSPSPAGEGKTTCTIGLVDGLRRLGHKAVAALREPSMGPVFGAKGGGSGAGRAQLTPAADVNLHFTGDLHAVTAAHNLLSAALDNHLHFGNALNLDVRRILWHRVMDVNDRALRGIVVGLGGKAQGVPREDRFDITAASEIMAILALSTDYADLKQRLERIVVGIDRAGNLVRAAQLKAAGAQAVLLKDALLPNLVQTLESSPALVHCGPFANIAHGTSSVLGTRLALERADWVVQEAGFGADLGAEKFLHIFCRVLGRYPSMGVLVVTLRALRFHGGVPAAQLTLPDREALERGLSNARAHLENLQHRGLPSVVALNVIEGDPEEDLEFVLQQLAPAFPVRAYQEGGAGARELAQYLVDHAGPPATVRPVYEPGDELTRKVEKIAVGVYGAGSVEYSSRAATQIQECAQYGFADSFVCVAKTQYSLSDDPKRVGRPRCFPLSVRQVYLLGGAGFVVPVAGDMMTMPGLSRSSNLERIDLAPDGTVTGV